MADLSTLVHAKSLTVLVILDHVGAAERTHDFIDGPDTQLPALHPGYQMYLKSFSEGPQPALPIVSEMEDPIECITPSSSKIENVACDEVSERTSDVKEGVDRHQKDELYWSAALVICVFMLGWAMIYSIWLVPLLDCSVKSYLSERNYPIVDVAAAVATPMELASAAVVYQQDNREEVPALRDWVDCLLGWTGDVCRRE